MNKKSLLSIVLTLLVVFSVFPAMAGEPIEGRDGRAEVRFLEGMIDHHQMALDMANDCLAKAQTESVLTVCQDVIDAQTAEIETMQGWLLDWYGITYTPMPMTNHMSMMNMMTMMGDLTLQEMQDMMQGMDMGMSMREMSDMMGGQMGHGHMGGETTNTDMSMMMGMMAGLDDLEGLEYEIAWLEAMIDHHDDAIHMSERILQRAVHPETLEMAQQIIDDQMAEIEAMESLLTELGANQ